jgi:ribosomal protein L40E
MFIPIQQIAIAGLIKNAGDSARDAAHNAREASETLKKIEEQNRETLKIIEVQNREINRLRSNQPSVRTQVADPKPPEAIRDTANTISLEVEREAKKFAKAHPTMLICPKCNNATLKKTKRCRHCDYVRL